ncbi:mannitol-1-phosphate 5-dehydrogenase [Alkalihalophilus marmarensis]|jgi:mannitol-1-phosphate 5-dehydrogenase|uniref:mannitol-1-phosphate 5-dehydrogenase n=1 Tax=Alkalihalophilus marmarensis TaxID=521377 RepID=UPI002040990A|nr:mannitol-1-phosphate 5-dehydrogenase [Alkalihalophilus marmarensis]MCM3489836.1 mannitol-1-phosphate 5-dehydrogenase [Alkalihalophilus marmarensis]
MNAVHFGAGNIGRGLIGYLLHQTGYHISFVDVNQPMIDRLNDNKSYTIDILDETRTQYTVSPVEALNSIEQEDLVIEALIEADIITTSVGVDNLSKISHVLSKALVQRAKRNKTKVDLISNENMLNASSLLKEEIMKRLTESEFDDIRSFVGFPNSVIDRLALSDDADNAQVEPYYDWIINQTEMRNHELPKINGATYVEDLTLFIERKLYVVNMAHAATAYLGFIEGETTIQDALDHPSIEAAVKAAMIESAEYISDRFGVDREEMAVFIEETLARFKNKNVRDEVLRVGRSPIRKVGPNERIVRPAIEVNYSGKSIEGLIKVIAAAFLFNSPVDNEAKELQEFVEKNGIKSAVSHYTKIENESVVQSICDCYVELKKGKKENTSC